MEAFAGAVRQALSQCDQFGYADVSHPPFHYDPAERAKPHVASACRRVSKAASQARWLGRPKNRDYFRGPENVARVQAWRAADPGYGRGPAPKKNYLLIAWAQC